MPQLNANFAVYVKRFETPGRDGNTPSRVTARVRAFLCLFLSLSLALSLTACHFESPLVPSLTSNTPPTRTKHALAHGHASRLSSFHPVPAPRGRRHLGTTRFAPSLAPWHASTRSFEAPTVSRARLVLPCQRFRAEPMWGDSNPRWQRSSLALALHTSDYDHTVSDWIKCQ